MATDFKIEISKGLYDSLLDRYEKEKLSLVAINVNVLSQNGGGNRLNVAITRAKNKW